MAEHRFASMLDEGSGVRSAESGSYGGGDGKPPVTTKPGNSVRRSGFLGSRTRGMQPLIWMTWRRTWEWMVAYSVFRSLIWRRMVISKYRCQAAVVPLQ
jgi:hypothetical protein